MPSSIKNLEKRLQSRTKLSEKDIRYYVRQVIEALMYIHSKNILHREYTPSYAASSFAIST